MKVQCNSIMNAYLDTIGYDFLMEKRALPRDLDECLEFDYLSDLDILVLTNVNVNISTPTSFTSDLQRSQWEYDKTHFHPDEFASTDTDEIKYLVLALECARRLAEELQFRFDDMSFKISVSFYETVKTADEIEFYGSSTVRVIRNRLSCEDAMARDLEAFKLEAMLEIDT